MLLALFNMLNPFSGLKQQLLVFVLPAEATSVTNGNLGILKFVRYRIWGLGMN